MFCPLTGDKYLSTSFLVPYLVRFLNKSSPTNFGFLTHGVYHVPPYSFPNKLVSLALL